MILAVLFALQAPATASPCTLATAVPASVRDMARDRDRWLGRCVQIEGYAVWNIFYTDVAGAYAAQASNQDDRINDGWLGVYYAFRAGWRRDLRRGTLFGVLHHCGRDYDATMATAGPDTIVMSFGYCHYRAGLTLYDAGFRSAGSARFERRMDEASRARFGDLTAQGPGRDPPPEAVRLADRFLAGVRAGDAGLLEAFVSLWSDVDPGTPAEREAFRSYLAGEGASPLAALRAAGSTPQRAYFQEAVSQTSAAEAETGDWHICFCRTADCSGRWPISHVDASAGPSRPYVCVRAYKSDMSAGPPDRLGIDRRDGGFAEPRLSSTR